MSDAMIEVSNVVKVYRRGKTEVRALDGVSLTVPKGQFLSVMGSSGSGKSTMLNLLGARRLCCTTYDCPQDRAEHDTASS